MNINVNVRIESPELMAALLALAEAIPQRVESKTITLEYVREKLSLLSQAGKSKEVKALIQRFGGSKLSEVAEENYELLLKEAEGIQ